MTVSVESFVGESCFLYLRDFSPLHLNMQCRGDIIGKTNEPQNETCARITAEGLCCIHKCYDSVI